MSTRERSALGRALGFAAVVIGAVVFYFLGIGLWGLVADPPGWAIFAAFIAVMIAGNRLVRYYGFIDG